MVLVLTIEFQTFGQGGQFTMGKIVAIGGGEFSKQQTLSIDKYIISISGKANPVMLFIPTASNDAPEYIKRVENYFGSLGCKVCTLCLITNSYNEIDIREKILSADIIYVGGGDTESMIKVWKRYSVDVFLKEAYRNGTVLSGISAGAICWFKFGHSDSEYFTNPDNWEYTLVDGIGLINAINCPHYNEEGRSSFDDMIKDFDTIPGIALENGTAFVEIDGNYYVISSMSEAISYKICYENGLKKKAMLPFNEIIEI